jgi:hypothetical protein
MSPLVWGNLAKSIMLQMHVAVMLHNPKATQAR